MLVGVGAVQLRHAVLRGGGQALLGGAHRQRLLAVGQRLVQVLRLLVVVAHRGRRGVVRVPLAARPQAPAAGALLLHHLGRKGEGVRGRCLGGLDGGT